MIIKLLIVVAVLGLALIVGEFLKHRLGFSNEWSRKLVHILHAMGIVVLSFIVPLSVIIALETGFLLLVGIGRYLYARYPKAGWIYYLGEMYRVGRLSYGEFFFPVSIIIAALFAETSTIFAAAVLVLGVADTLAALVGKAYGTSNSYKIFGQKKSVIGSAAFFVVAVLIMWGFIVVANVPSGAVLAVLLGVSVVLTIAENLGLYGSDNLTIPLIAVLSLNILT